MSHTNARLISSTTSDLLNEQSYLFQWDLNVGKVDAHVCKVSALVLCFSLQMYLLTEQNYLWLVLQCREHKPVWGSRTQEKEQIAKRFGFLWQVAGVVNLLCFGTPHFQFFCNLVTLTSHKHCLFLTRNVDC